jgi:hypothetical protein
MKDAKRILLEAAADDPAEWRAAVAESLAQLAGEVAALGRWKWAITILVGLPEALNLLR